MLPDHGFRTLPILAAGCAMMTLDLIAMRPGDGRTATARAGGSFEVPVAGIGGRSHWLVPAE